MPLAGTDNPLWDFSLELYATADVASVCLELQRSIGANVNLLLLCCWCAVQGRQLPAQWFASLQQQQALVQWQSQCIKPLRRLRNEMKQLSLLGAGALRNKIKALELEAEKLEQDYLLRALPAQPEMASEASPVLLRRNLSNYLEAAKLEPIAPALALPLMRAAFPDCSEAELLSAIGV